MNSRLLTRTLSALSALALACAVAAAAQMPGPGAGPTPQGEQAPPTGGNTPGNPDGLPTTQGAAPSFVDQSFLRKTLEDNQVEVQMGQLAAQKSTSPDVKQFGEKMAEVHQQLTTQIDPVAKKLDVSEPKSPSKKEKEALAKMQTLSGAEFDAAFIRAMLKEQESDLKEFKSEAQSAQDPAVKQLAKLDEPVLSQHLQILEQLAQAHNVTVIASKD